MTVFLTGGTVLVQPRVGSSMLSINKMSIN